jgi:hypothetical protein
LLQWSLQFPELGVAHAAKEAFFEIYDEPSKVAAQRAAQAWLERLPDMVAKEFRETSVALRSWWDEIFAWYDYPVSNAYTESVNRLAKDLNRMGRGYSFDVVRARLLLDPEARKPTTKSIRSRTPKPSTNSGFSSFAGSMSMGRMVPQIAYDITEKTVEYGPHIPTLCRLLEAGHFD